jgi:poly(3-hydroxybutyrate) depolymerase
MFYQSFEFYQKSLQAWNPFFDLGRNLLSQSSAFYPDATMNNSLKALLEAGIDLTKPYDKPQFGINHVVVDEDRFHVRETTVLEKPFCKLLHFEHTDGLERPKVLLIAALSGHHATLCKSTVETLIPTYDLYITDWIDAKHVPIADGKFGFDEYVSYLIEFLELLGAGSHIIAVCQPVVQALIATAVLAKRKSPVVPVSLTLMAGPVDTRINANQVNDFALRFPREWYEQTLIHTVPFGYAGAGRRVYPGFLQLGSFLSMNLSSHIEKFQRYFQHLLNGEMDFVERHREFYDEYLAVLDLTEDFYMETMDRVFREHHLPTGVMTWQGEFVDLGAVTETALFTIEGADDDICAAGQTEAALALCKNLSASKKQHYIQRDVGHYGVFSGSKFREHIAPRIIDFIRRSH